MCAGQLNKSPFPFLERHSKVLQPAYCWTCHCHICHLIYVSIYIFEYICMCVFMLIQKKKSCWLQLRNKCSKVFKKSATASWAVFVGKLLLRIKEELNCSLTEINVKRFFNATLFNKDTADLKHCAMDDSDHFKTGDPWTLTQISFGRRTQCEQRRVWMTTKDVLVRPCSSATKAHTTTGQISVL